MARQDGMFSSRRTLVSSGAWLLWLAVVPASWGQDIVIPSGLIKVLDQAEIATPEAGVLAELHVAEGTVVTPRQVMARLDDTDAVLGEQRAEREVAIAAAEAASRVRIQAAEADLQTAENDLQRARESQQRFPRSVSVAEMERFELSVRQGKLAVEQAEHEQTIAGLTLRLKESELALAQRVSQRRRLEAPFEGTVVQIYHRPGEWVEPGTKLLRLVRTDRLRVEAFVGVDLVTSPLVGRSVSLVVPRPDGGELVMPGTVTFVSPEVDPVNRQVRLLADIPNPQQQLRPGLSAKLVLHAGE
jgi:RND family efflux transporter MFP subunit